MKLKQPSSLSVLAGIAGCAFAGNPDQIVLGFNEIHMVESGDVTFVDVEKYYDKALNSKATIIIINKEITPPPGKGLLFHPEPFTLYNQLTEHFQPRYSTDTEGSPVTGVNVRTGRNVVFGTGVEIGENTEIGHNTVIGSEVKIGKNCVIYPNVTILDNSIIGDNVCINSGAVIGGEGFYFKSRKDSREKLLTKGRVVIHDNVDIGANCTIDRGVSGDTVIGEWTKLDSLIQVGHDTVIGKRCVIAAQVGIAGVVTIEDDVILWGQVGINKDLTIGKGAILLGKAGVMSSLEGGKKYLGMIAHDYRSTLKEEAALRRLPEWMADIEKKINRKS
ncbi:MAG: UDP-3-O-(3-hydroxymyristoyl)glucosamine N-acyltransferase [Bacteroidia bacterium]|nr:UDP-3-O-(3-hydroxymyristoyl)glucosamine N-acyltransferase [Bacteroidia bacterium]